MEIFEDIQTIFTYSLDVTKWFIYVKANMWNLSQMKTSLQNYPRKTQDELSYIAKN
jgi:hypothetical protein